MAALGETRPNFEGHPNRAMNMGAGFYDRWRRAVRGHRGGYQPAAGEAALASFARAIQPALRSISNLERAQDGAEDFRMRGANSRAWARDFADAALQAADAWNSHMRPSSIFPQRAHLVTGEGRLSTGEAPECALSFWGANCANSPPPRNGARARRNRDGALHERGGRSMP